MDGGDLRGGIIEELHIKRAQRVDGGRGISVNRIGILIGGRVA